MMMVRWPWLDAADDDDGASSSSYTFVVNSYINIRIYTSRTPLYVYTSVYIEALTLSQHRTATKRFSTSSSCFFHVSLMRCTYVCLCVFFNKKKNARRTYKIFSIITNCVAVYVCAHVNIMYKLPVMTKHTRYSLFS